MINILTDYLPKTVEICGQKYPINSDFRAAVEFEILIQSDASPRRKTRGAIRIFFGGNPPPYSEKELVEAAVNFYAGVGNDSDERPKKNRKRIYSFAQDGDYIAAAFRSQYGIDLLTIPYMHWYEFRALFKGLEESCEIVKIMGYRAAELSKIKYKPERERIARLQEIYKIKSGNAKRFLSLADRNAAMRAKVIADIENATKAVR